LFQIFSSGKPEQFRTLTYLLDPNQEYETENGHIKVTLTESDKDLLDQIIQIETKIEELIVSKAGLVDEPTLMFDYTPNPEITDVELKNTSLMAAAITHFRILKLACQGHFRGEVNRFKDFVYPRELNTKLEEKIKVLQEELDQLSKE